MWIWTDEPGPVALIAAALTDAYAQGRRAGLEEAAQVLVDEVAAHTDLLGGHQCCEDYGCHYLLTLADKIKAIRAQAAQEEGA